MKFHEVLRRTEWAAVEDALQRHYPEDAEKSLKGFRLVQEILRQQEPIDGPWTLLADALEDEGHDCEDLPVGEAPAHVYCHKPDDGIRYSIGFTPRAEVLGMEVEIHPRYSEAEMVAHVLWEITWYGFAEEDVQKFASELGVRIQELHDMTPEEREKNLVPWDEVKSRLDLDEEPDKS